MDMKEQLYTRDQVTEIFHVGPRTIDRWLRNGELRRADTPGGIVRIPASEIERRLQAIPQLDASRRRRRHNMRYWVKLYTEIVNDPKMGRLTDRQFRTCINLFALAGEIDADGALPDVEDLAWRLRLKDDDLAADLKSLVAVNILAETPTAGSSQNGLSARQKRRQPQGKKYCNEYTNIASVSVTRL